MAQNVTVHPGNGNMLPALKSTGGDIFYAWNGFATWKHEQLSLTITTGDSDNNASVNANGQIETPANDIFATPSNNTGAARYLQIAKGGRNYVLDTYVTFCLPEGYRFTGYTITFHRINYPTADGISYRSGSSWGTQYQRIYWTQDNGDETYSNLVATTGSISFGETDKTFTYTNTTNTTSTNPTSYRGGISQGTTEQYTISRNGTDMKNILYFKLSAGDNIGRAFIQLDKVELKFTAEHNYTTLLPASGETEKTAMDISFRTGKMDYGVLQNRTDYEGNSWNPDWSKTRISYDGTIFDMDANITLYELGSVEQVSSNGFDGTAGKVVKYQDNGSISTAGDGFKLESSKHKGLTEETGDTAIYFLESPIWASRKATTANPNPPKNPIGYRIVGAKFNLTAGTASTYIPATFYIGYYDEGVYYRLNDFNTQYNLNNYTLWRMDEEGYIYYQDRYLAVSGDLIIQVTEKSNASMFEVVDEDEDGVSEIRVKDSTDQYIGWRMTQANDGEDIWIPVITNDPSHICFYDEQTPASGGSHGKYTFLVYDKTGTYVLEKRVVDGDDDEIEVSGYNNDAIKIGVIGTAIFEGSLTMQALDPYIDRLRIVCEEQGGNGGKVSQQFNATDFSVKGGPFTFYVPTSFTGNAKFTFDDLYSKYGDDTYYEETTSTNHARYFFVGSTYGDSNDNVYQRDSTASYTTKIACLQPGNKKYPFNNAATVTQAAGNQFEEYPFTKALYASKVSGQFTDFIFPSGSMNGNTTKTAYLFTCDETRYNIAPTTATQHVYYAFYQMDIKMRRMNYDPKFTWVPVYDHTCYNNGTSTAVIDKPQYGLKLGTTAPSEEGDPNGYLTVSQVKNAIQAACVEGNTTGAPESTEQILYIDGSELQSLVEDKQNNVEMTLEKLREGLGDNALVYLPKGTTSEYSNIAYMTPTGKFWGADDFELIDMRPFYAPYDIQIDPEKEITYKRSITVPKNGKVTSASIILPFAIDLTNAPFTLHKMQAQNCLNGTADEVYFPVVSGDTKVTKAEANTPYMLKVTNPGSEDKYSFVLTQAGTTIKATPTNMVKTGDLKYTFTGETGNGAKDGKAIEFVNHGTYAGLQLPYDGYYFYFSKNMFLRSNDYTYKGTIKMAPFRIFYSATGEGRAKLAAFDIIFDEGMGDTPDGINSLTRRADLMVTAGKGTITMASTIDQDVRVNNLNGMLINNVSLQSGEMHTINVPTGIYVVNGVKIIVK